VGGRERARLISNAMPNIEGDADWNFGILCMRCRHDTGPGVEEVAICHGQRWRWLSKLLFIVIEGTMP
jgi:hypothetical protein